MLVYRRLCKKKAVLKSTTTIFSWGSGGINATMGERAALP